MRRTLLVCLGLASTMSFLGCSSSSPPPGGNGSCVDLTQLPTTPAISFRQDLMPIFGLSCIQSSCHNKDVAKAGLVLGDPSACTAPMGNCFSATAKWKYAFPTPPPEALVAQVLTNLVNTPSKTIATVARVKPTDPANSFLMDKVLGSQNDKFGASGTCQNQDTSKSTDPCGATMPLDSPSLCDQAAGDPAKVQAIAMWIQQGAQNN